MKSSAVLNGSFAPTVQFEKLEIHKVFLRFSNFHSCQNLSLITLADFIIGYLSQEGSIAMSQKPKIQYVGQFYIHGSEARQLEQEAKRKQARSKLPLERLRSVREISLDPVAIGGIFVSLVLLAVMIVGALQLKTDWANYRIMDSYVSRLSSQNAELVEEYRSQYDLEDIRSKAEALGMVPREDLETRSVYVTVPQSEPEPTWWENLQWFLEGLFA